MIAYKTFTNQLDTRKDLPTQQNELRNQLLTFINDTAVPERVIQINEWVQPENHQFTITVWYWMPTAKVEAESDINLLPEAQSADVLAQTLREKDRRERVNTMIDEHRIAK